jgi:5,10-methylenetetrahydromethanopterin reductase
MTVPPEESIRTLKLAEELGFDEYQTVDEVPSSVWRDPFVSAAIIATHTRHGMIRCGIFNPYTRHPALYASFLATVNELAPGRVGLILAPGGSLPLDPCAIPMWDKPLAAVRESILVIRRLLAGETVTYAGEKVSVKNAHIAYHPVQKVPIWLAARGPKMLELAGELADGVLLGNTPMIWIDYAKEMMRKGAARAGRSIEDIEIIQGLRIQVTDDAEAMLERLKTHFAPSIAGCPNEVWEKMGIDLSRIDAIRQLIAQWGPVTGSEKARDLVTMDLVESRGAIIGRPEDCLQKVDAWFNAGLTHAGIVTVVESRKNIELVGQRLIPHYKRNG